jgi:uncharacterized membrane protein YadS
VQHLLAEVILAVLLGLLIGNVTRLPAAFLPGVRFSYQTVLRTAIVLLGASLSMQQVLAIGGRALAMIAVLMTVALFVAYALGRAMRVPARLAALIGVGTAVCGNSAIAATAPVIGARDEEVSFAIATNTLFGTLAVFAYPALGRLLSLADPHFGTWAGLAVNDTSQVVATGFAYSDAAGRVATAVKLTRNALMGPVIVLMGLAYGGGAGGTEGPAGRVAGTAGDAAAVPRTGSSLLARARQSVPPFVLLFLAMAALNSLGAFDRLADATGRPVPQMLQGSARALVLVALAGVGLGARFSAMRAIGARPFYLGLATALVTSTLAFLLVRALGPATG